MNHVHSVGQCIIRLISATSAHSQQSDAARTYLFQDAKEVWYFWNDLRGYTWTSQLLN